jgi:hypothetical protein
MKLFLQALLNAILILGAILLAMEYQSSRIQKETDAKIKEALVLLDNEVRDHIIQMDSTINSLENNIYQINQIPLDSIGIKAVSLEYTSLDLTINAFEIARFTGSLEEIPMKSTAEILEYYEATQYLLKLEEQAVQSFYLDLDQYQNLMVAQRSMVALKTRIEENRSNSNKLLDLIRVLSKV